MTNTDARSESDRHEYMSSGPAADQDKKVALLLRRQPWTIHGLNVLIDKIASLAERNAKGSFSPWRCRPVYSSTRDAAELTAMAPMSR
jgi:hypothetical protein